VYVLKELKEEEDESRSMFLQEIRMLSKLRHPNVIKCCAVIFHEGHLAYLTEYIEGK
jgi:serine/threonine protein kinase